MSISLLLLSSIHKKWRVIGNLSKDRSNNFDAIRFLAASAVIFSHSYPVTTGNDNKEVLYILSKGQITCGSIAVAIFFTVSGFLICYSWEKSNSTITFLKSRILRIFPGLFFVLLFAMFILGPLVTDLPLKYYFFNIKTYTYIESITLHNIQQYYLPGVFIHNIYHPIVGPIVNASLWTLEYEFLFYIIVAILGIIGALRKSSVLGFFIIFFALPVTLRYIHLSPWCFNTMELFRYFAAGMIFYLFRMYIPLNRYLAFLSASILILLLFIGKFVEIFPLPGSYLIFYFAFSKNIKLYSFAKYGDFSYGLYIYSFPIQQTITFYFHNDIYPLANFIFSYPIVLTFAIISWHIIERPFLKLKNKNNYSEGIARFARTGSWQQRNAEHK
jgi:peptidoglycan/LPS O-acetylase OafA/YrhL